MMRDGSTSTTMTEACVVATGDRFNETQQQPATPVEPSPRLAAELRRRRLERGWSLRRAANELRISSSSLLDYEKERRIPAEELIDAFERTLGLPADVLQSLRREALIERAQEKAIPRSAADSPRPPADAPGTPVGGSAPVDPATGRPGRLTRRLPWRRMVESILCAVIGAVVTLSVQAISHQRRDIVATPTGSRAVMPIRQVADDQDPHDTTCDRDSTTVGTADVLVTQPYRFVVAQVVARYSPSCAAIWVRFEPTPALDRLAPNAHVTLLLERPADQRRLAFGGGYVGVPLWSNMLLTRPGCVIATLQLTDPAVPAGTTASTSCLNGPPTSPSHSGR
jgi:transcriptional regulator with XRE-family HTH domain